MPEIRVYGNPDQYITLCAQVQSTTQQLGQICTEGVGEAKRRLEENRPGIDQFVKNIGDNMQQGVKKVQEVRRPLTSQERAASVFSVMMKLCWPLCSRPGEWEWEWGTKGKRQGYLVQ